MLTLCATAVLVAACTDESSSPGTSTTVAVTTTVAAPTATTVASTVAPTTSSTTTSTVPATTTSTSTTIAAVRGLPLSAKGLGDALFDADADGVIDYVNSILGIPTTDSGWIDPAAAGAACPGTEVRFVDWNDLSLFFTNDGTGVRHFASFTYGPAFASTIAPYGLATEAGIGVGATVAALRAAYPTVGIYPEDGFNGPGFEIQPGLYGVLTGVTETDVVMSFVGGFGCGE